MRLSPQVVNHPQKRIAWIDGLRIIGALLIFAYHFEGDWQYVFGESSPTASGLGKAYAAAAPHFATWAISLFVMLAGLSLTLAWRPGVKVTQYLRRRALRLLLPLWIVGIPYTAVGVAMGLMPTQDLWKVPFWLLGLGVVSPVTYLPVSEAWWYVTLALQCALVVPVVMWLLDRMGVEWTMFTLIVTEILSLCVIMRLPSEWHYLAQGLVLARLMEFGVGVLAAQVLCRRTETAKSIGLALALAVAALVADGLGAVTPFQTIVLWMAVILGSTVVLGDSSASSRFLVLAGLATYPFYLAHAPIGKYTVRILSSIGIDSRLVIALAAFTLSGAVAFAVVRAHSRIAQRVRLGAPQ